MGESCSSIIGCCWFSMNVLLKCWAALNWTDRLTTGSTRNEKDERSRDKDREKIDWEWKRREIITLSTSSLSESIETLLNYSRYRIQQFDSVYLQIATPRSGHGNLSVTSAERVWPILCGDRLIDRRRRRQCEKRLSVGFAFRLYDSLNSEHAIDSIWMFEGQFGWCFLFETFHSISSCLSTFRWTNTEEAKRISRTDNSEFYLQGFVREGINK